MGLLTIKDIVERDLKGKINLESVQGVGTEIKIVIPKTISPEHL
jgi:chemotaxis protein histidine kinase CheA